MKTLLLSLLFLFQFLTVVASASVEIKGLLSIEPACLDGAAMVWLSIEHDQADHLLYHVSVPHKGSFAFSVKPGEYLMRVSSAKNCEWSEKIVVSDSVVKEIILVEKP